MSSSSKPQNNHGIMDEGDDHDSVFSSSDVSSNSNNSSLSDFMDDATSSTSSTPPSSSSSSSSDQHCNGPLYEMSSLMQQLPFKRGLSKYFQGKSQSFTSLSNVRSLEDLVKPENPYNKKLKYCKSYGGLSESYKPYSSKVLSKTISKKASRSSCSSLNVRKNSFLGNSKPPTPPQRTNNVFA